MDSVVPSANFEQCFLFELKWLIPLQKHQNHDIFRILVVLNFDSVKSALSRIGCDPFCSTPFILPLEPIQSGAEVTHNPIVCNAKKSTTFPFR